MVEIATGTFYPACGNARGSARAVAKHNDQLSIGTNWNVIAGNMVELVGIEPTTSSLRIMRTGVAEDSSKKHN
jgi:hypothetical protein